MINLGRPAMINLVTAEVGPALPSGHAKEAGTQARTPGWRQGPHRPTTRGLHLRHHAENHGMASPPRPGVAVNVVTAARWYAVFRLIVLALAAAWVLWVYVGSHDDCKAG